MPRSKRQTLAVRFAAVATAASVWSAPESSAQVLYEPFDYGATGPTNLSSATPAGARYGTQGTFWATRGVTNTAMLRDVAIPAPAYMGGSTVLPGGFGTSARATTTGNGETAVLGFGEYFDASGDLYWSAVVKPNTIPSSTNGVMVAGIASFSMPTGSEPTTRQLALWTRQTSATTYQLGLGSNSGASANVVWSGNFTGTTDSHFVVGKLTINSAATADDVVEMWIDPTSNFGEVTPAPTANAFSYLTLNSASDLNDSLTNGGTVPAGPAQSGFFIRGGVTGTGNMHVDELRVDSTWAGVTPDGNKQFTWNGAATGGNLADATWAKTAAQPAANPNGLGHVANLGTLGVAGTALDAGAVITTAGETLDAINIRNANGITLGGSGVTISSNASAGQVVAYSGAHTIAAPLTLASDVAVKANTGASLTLTGAIAGAGKTVQKFGQGNVVLGAANLLAADVNLDVRAGAIDMGGFAQRADTVTLGVAHANPAVTLGGPDNSPGSIVGAAGSSITANAFDLRSGTIGVPMGGTNVNVTKRYSGTVTLSGHNTYTGTTTVDRGTLVLSGTNDNPVIVVINSPFSPANSTVSVLQIASESNLGAAPGSPVTNALTIGGGGRLRVTGNTNLSSNSGVVLAGAGAGIVEVSPSATLTVNGPVSGAGGLSKVGSGTVALTGQNAYAGSTGVSAGTLVAGHEDAISTGRALSIADSATARAQAGLAKALDVGPLTMTASGATGGTLDLTDNAIAVRHADQAAASAGHTTINGLVRNAFNEFAWNQPGITSTKVQADVAAGIPAALGILLNNDGAGGALFYGNGTDLPLYEGRAVDANTVMVEQTLLGDGDLNGTVDSVDFALFQAGYTGAAPYIGFAFGDYDYNGVIDSVDFGLFQAGYEYSQSNPTPEMVAFAAEHHLSLVAAAVPEPATLSLLGLGAIGLMARRRRN